MRTEEHSPPGRRHPRPRRHLHKEVMGEELAAPLPTSSLAVMDASPTMDRKERFTPEKGISRKPLEVQLQKTPQDQVEQS